MRAGVTLPAPEATFADVPSHLRKKNRRDYVSRVGRRGEVWLLWLSVCKWVRIMRRVALQIVSGVGAAHLTIRPVGRTRSVSFVL